MDVVYAANNNYAIITGISIISLFENNKDCSDLSVYILSDNICSVEFFYDIGEKYQRAIHIIDVTEALSIFEQNGAGKYANEKGGGGYAAFAKLLIPDLLQESERVVYLDSDTLIVGNIFGLFCLDMQGKPIGMAHDCIQNKYKRFIGLNVEAGYYNSGVLVFDIMEWKKKRCFERIIEHIISVRSKYPLPDQDLINIVLHDDIYRISAIYNYLSQYFLYPYEGMKKVYDLNKDYFYSEQEFPGSNEAVIMHFCGQTFIRPWYSNSKHPQKKIYDYYYKLSLWRIEEQEKCNWTLPYKVQYLLRKYVPTPLSVICGKIMQRLFIWMNYKV